MMTNAPKGVEYVAPLLAFVTIALSIPLVLRKIPPNVIYGVRTRKTLSDPRIWYEANYRGGKDLLLGGAVALACWMALALILGPRTAALPGIFVCVATAAVACIACLLRLRNL